MSPRILAAAAAVLLGGGSNAIAIDGDPVPVPGDSTYDNSPLLQATEAICGVGYTPFMRSDFDCYHWGGWEHRNTGSGILIAPNMVLTAGHVVETWVDVGETDPGTESCNGVTASTLSVRFRKNPDGSIGSKSAGWESYYQVEVKSIIWPQAAVTAGDSYYYDSAILVLADNVSDSPWSTDGWITHIDPIPLLLQPGNTNETLNVVKAGWGLDGTGAAVGVLRYAEDTMTWQQGMNSGVPYWHGSFSTPHFETGDSGGGVIAINDCGDPMVVFNISHMNPYRLLNDGVFFGEYTVADSGPPLIDYAPQYIDPGFDFTGSLVAGDSALGAPDLRVDLRDVMYVAVETSAGTAGFDLDGNSSVNEDDFRFFATQIAAACDPSSAYGFSPFEGEWLDVDEDGRFTRFDVAELATRIGSTDPSDLAFDFDRDSAITQDDVDLLDLVRDPQQTGSIATKVFDHGLLGDTDGDGTIECADANAIKNIIAFDGYPFTEALYNSSLGIELDADLDGTLSPSDAAAVAREIRPGEVNVTGGAVSASLFLHDFKVDRWDAISYIYQLVVQGVALDEENFWLDRTGSADSMNASYGLPDGDADAEDLLYYLSNESTCAGGLGEPLMFFDLDVDLDGRVNYDDATELFAQISSSTAGPEWDLNADASVDIADLDLLVTAIFRTYPGAPTNAPWINHGFLGDFDRDATPQWCDCSGIGPVSYDLCEAPISTYPWSIISGCEPQARDLAADCDDYVALAAVVDTIDDPFDGRAYPDAGYQFELDADLDGDNDTYDRVLVFTSLEPADMDADGNLDSNDVDAFTDAFLADDMLADMDGNGILNVDDISAFSYAFQNPACP